MARKPVSDRELAAAWWTIVVEEDPDPGPVLEAKRVILEALRGDVAHLWVRRFVAGELQRCWLSTPATRTQDRAAARHVEACGLQMTIDQTAERDNISQAEAREKVAADFGFPTVEALEQFLLRNKARA
jgi:hypothetical protein